MSTFGGIWTPAAKPTLCVPDGGAAEDYGWQPKRGQSIAGSGIDVTTLKLVEAEQAGAHYFAIGHPLGTGPSDRGTQMDFFEVSDLTVDCNLGQFQNVACGAVRIKGHHAVIRRIKAVQWGSRVTNSPAHVLSVITSDPNGLEPAIHNTGLRDCLVLNPAAASTAGAVLLRAGVNPTWAWSALNTSFGQGAFVRDCRAEGASATLTAAGWGFSLSACMGGVVEGNQFLNLRCGGPGIMPWHTGSVVVRENHFSHVLLGPAWVMPGADAGAPRLGHALVERNVINLAASPDGLAQPGAIVFGDTSEPTEPPTYAFGDVTVRDNIIRCAGGSVPNLAVGVSGATRLLLRENLVENGPAQPLVEERCETVRYFNNRTAAGDLIPRIDPATGKAFLEYDGDADDALTVAVLKR